MEATCGINAADPDEVWKEDEPRFCDSYSEVDPEEGDYARVLELINEFLPVKELAGRLVGVPVLRQFGLVENEKVDDFLATAFAKRPEQAEGSLKGAKQKSALRTGNVQQSRPANK